MLWHTVLYKIIKGANIGGKTYKHAGRGIRRTRIYQHTIPPYPLPSNPRASTPFTESFEGKHSLLLLSEESERSDKVAIVGNVLREQRTEALNVVTPVAVELAGRAKPRHQLRTIGYHTRPRSVASHRIECAGGISHNKHLKILREGGEDRERDAHLSDDASNNKLLFAGSPHRGHKVLIVPGVDLAGAGNEGGIREHRLELRDDRAVGTLLKRGRKDGGEVEVLRECGEGEDISLELIGINIADEGQKASLVVDEQHSGVVLVEADVGLGGGGGAHIFKESIDGLRFAERKNRKGGTLKR
mgnify:CR=1 FL=1